MEVVYAALLSAWVLFIIYITKMIYHALEPRGKKVALYFTRKIIHIFAAGFVTLIIAIFKLFTSPLIPFLLGAGLATILYIFHRSGKLLYWFQDPENMYDVNFCIAWAFVISLGYFLGNVWIGAIPALFMAIGDGVTGIVRNALFRRRTKHWIGNLSMFLVCSPIAFYAFGFVGLIAAFIASLIEHFDFMDDNVTVPLSSFAVILLATVIL